MFYRSNLIGIIYLYLDFYGFFYIIRLRSILVLKLYLFIFWVRAHTILYLLKKEYVDWCSLLCVCFFFDWKKSSINNIVNWYAGQLRAVVLIESLQQPSEDKGTSWRPTIVWLYNKFKNKVCFFFVAFLWDNLRIFFVKSNSSYFTRQLLSNLWPFYVKLLLLFHASNPKLKYLLSRVTIIIVRTHSGVWPVLRTGQPVSRLSHIFSTLSHKSCSLLVQEIILMWQSRNTAL